MVLSFARLFNICITLEFIGFAVAASACLLNVFPVSIFKNFQVCRSPGIG